MIYEFPSEDGEIGPFVSNDIVIKIKTLSFKILFFCDLFLIWIGFI